MRALAASLALFFAAVLPTLALTSADRVVPLWAASGSNGLILNWSTGGQAQAWIVQKKPLLQPGWSTLATLSNAAACAFTDTTAVAGSPFEYKVTRRDAITNAWGFLYAGFNSPPVSDRGGLLLVVESQTATALAPELDRFARDLAADGWSPVRLTAPRKEWSEPGWAAAVTNLKAQILAACAADPSIEAVLLFGHVPVPYSGNLAPDGHGNHEGAWPADAYYGDLDGTWTDTLSSITNSERQVNRPGDGKFDTSEYTNFCAELMVGRIDLAALPAFAQPERELLRQYLAKNHQYRLGRVNAPKRGLVKDGFGFFGSGEAFAQNGLRDFGTWYGPSNVAAADWFPALRTASNGFESAYGCGSGWYTSANGVGTTADFATGPVHTVFALLFGSYFGDWDTENNLLRASLASTPWTLASTWAGRPKWYAHPMDLGEPIGRVFQLLQGLGYEDYEDELRLSGVQTALMGDPTLRLRPPPPPRASASVTGSTVYLNWEQPPGTGWVYEVGRAAAGAAVFTNLSGGLTSQASLAAPLDGLTDAVFRVRAARLEAVRSGSYTNLGAGAWVRVVNGTVNRPPAATNVLTATLTGQPLILPLTATDPDGDACFPALTAWPVRGTLTGSPARLVYTPPPGFTGLVHWAYEASDGWADSSNAAITVNVTASQTVRGTSCAWLMRTIGFAADYHAAEELDPDGDGLATWAEYRAGTDPVNAASVFAILDLKNLAGSNRLAWFASTNSGITSAMAVLKGTSLPASGWPFAASNLPRHSSGTNVWVDTNTGPRLFYKVVIP